MATVIRGGQGFSTAFPKLGDIVITSGRGSGGGGGGRGSSGRFVSVSGGTVTIGGQGFSVPPSLQEEFIREQKRIQQQIREQIRQKEQRELSERLKTERQEKIFKGTIAGQISAPPTPTEQALAIGTGVPKPATKFTGKFFREKVVAPFFFAGEQGETVLTSLRNIGSLYRSKEKIGDIEFQAPLFGTVSDQPLPFGAGGGEITTQFKEQRLQALADSSLLIPEEVKFSRGVSIIREELVSELQPQVTSGKLSVEEAEKIFKTEFEKRFKQKIMPDIERGRMFRGKVRVGETPVFEGGTIAELGGTAALFTTPVGAAIVSTAFVAEGSHKFIAGETPIEKASGLVEVGFGLGGIGFATKGIERGISLGLRKELAEAEIQTQIKLAKLPKQRFNLLEGLERGSQRLKLDVPPATESLLVSQRTTFAGTEKKVSERIFKELSPKELEKLRVSILKTQEKTGLEKLTIFERTTTTKHPTKFDLKVGELGDIPKTIDFEKLAPLKKSPFIFKETVRKDIGVVSGLSEKDITRGFGIQFRVGSRGRLVERTPFIFKGGAELDTGEILFSSVQLRPSRVGRRKVGDFILETFPVGRVTGKEFTKIPKPQIFKDEGITITDLKATTFTQPIKSIRISPGEFLGEFAGAVPKRLRGGISSKEIIREVTAPIGEGVRITGTETLTQRGLEKSLSLKLEKQFFTSGKIKRIIPTVKGSKDFADVSVIPKGIKPTAGDISGGLVQKQIQETITKAVIPKPRLRPSRVSKVPTPTIDLKGIPRAVGGEGLSLITLTPSFLRRGGIRVTEELIGGFSKGSLGIGTVPTSRDSFLELEPTGVKGLELERDKEIFTTRLDSRGLKTFTGVKPVQRERTALGKGTKLFQKSALELKSAQQTFVKPSIEVPFTTTPITPRTPFRPVEGFGFGGFAFPPLLGGSGTRGKPIKRRKAKVPIRPSFTGIILEIEEAAIPTISAGVNLGILPGKIRGLATGFDVPKKKKKKSKKKKK